MAVVLQPYSSLLFNSLPSLEEVNLKAREADATSVIAKEIAALFVRYKINQYLGVQLLHHHFNLNEQERLVDVGGAAIPWRLDPSGTDLYSHILPASWAFKGDSFYPYEFQFIPATMSDTNPPATAIADLDEAFICEFNGILKQHGLQDVLGLRALKGKGGGSKPELEITQGRANVTFQYTPVENDTAIEATWAFEGEDSVVTHTYCVSYCSSRSGGGLHSQVHTTHR